MKGKISLGVPIENGETGEIDLLLRKDEIKVVEMAFKEIERLNNIINELEKYLETLHWFRLGKKEENGNMEYFYASVSNFYEDTKSILKGSDKE